MSSSRSVSSITNRGYRTLHYEAKLSQQYGFQYLASLQEESTRQLEKKLCRVLKLLGETGEDCQPETPEPETLSIRPGIAEHLDSEFVKAYPDGYGLTLKDGSNGMRYHLDRSLGISRPGGTTGAVPAIEKYLHLMKCVFLLEKVKSSHEYAEKVKGARNLLWFAVLQDLEDVSFTQYISPRMLIKHDSVAGDNFDDILQTSLKPIGSKVLLTMSSGGFIKTAMLSISRTTSLSRLVFLQDSHLVVTTRFRICKSPQC